MIRLIPALYEAVSYVIEDQSSGCARKMAALAYGWTLKGLLKESKWPFPLPR